MEPRSTPVWIKAVNGKTSNLSGLYDFFFMGGDSLWDRLGLPSSLDSVSLSSKIVGRVVGLSVGTSVSKEVEAATDVA